MAWTQTTNIRGASGVPGASGTPGASGPAGPTGATGATGASGGTGGTGGPGSTNWADIVDKPGAILNYKGTWNASTNSPTLSDATGSGGDVYRVSVAASRNLGSGTIAWDVGDYAIWSPVTSSWEKADTTDAVSSVAGRTGAVTLTSADLGASGSASSSTFLRGDNTWATPTGVTRSISTITSNTTVGSTASTDYVVLVSSTPVTDSTITSLVSGDGSNNSTSVTDAIAGVTWTTAGNAKLSTSVKKYGTASISFDGTNSTVTASPSTSFAFGTGDFTVEFWVYFTSLTSNGSILYDGRSSADGAFPAIFATNGAGSGLVYRANGAAQITGGTLATSTWYHIAVARSGTATKMFLNGSQVGSTYTDSTNYSGNTNRPMLGRHGFLTDFYLTGYIDDLRVSKGKAQYTSNFTAPTEALTTTTLVAAIPTLPTAASNTNLYTIKNINASFSVTVGVTSGQLIDGASGGLALSAGSTARLISDGSGWRTV